MEAAPLAVAAEALARRARLRLDVGGRVEAAAVAHRLGLTRTPE